MTDTPPPPPKSRSMRQSGASRGWWMSLLLGIATAGFGLLPHLLNGARLPLQNLWATPALPEDMPLTLLPVSQYYVWLVMSMLIVGGALAGILARPLGRLDVSRAGLAIGVALCHLAAIVQSFTAVGLGLRLGEPASNREELYFAGMLGVAVLGAISAQTGLWLVSHTSRAIAALGLALAADPTVEWLMAWAQLLFGQFNAPVAVYILRPWLPAVIVGLALAWCGLGRSRVWVWAVSLLSLLVIPTVVGPVQFVLGSRAVLSMWWEIPDVLVQDLLATAPGMAWPVLLAAVIGLVGAWLHTTHDHRLRPADLV